VRSTLLALLALTLAVPASAQDPAPEASVPDPSFVLTVGPQLAVSAALFESEIIGVDPMLMASLEFRIDKRISGRIEGGGSPFRGRVHAGIAGRAYPNGRGRAAWYGELGFQVQRTGTKVRIDEWAPLPARVWVSLPLHAGGGWRFVVGDNVVIDLMGSVGTTVEVRPQASFLLAFGISGTAAATFGFGF
jgi:hypothetical protein